MKTEGFFSFLIVILLTISFTGCFSDDDEGNSKEIVPLNVLISNDDSVEYSLEMNISDSDGNIIYNQNLSLNPNEKKDIRNITKEKGKYIISIQLNDGRNKSYQINVGAYYYYVYVEIHDDDIQISQLVE